MSEPAGEMNELETRGQAFHTRSSHLDLAPRGRVLHGLLPVPPETPAHPAIWRFAEARPFLMEANISSRWVNFVRNRCSW